MRLRTLKRERKKHVLRAKGIAPSKVGRVALRRKNQRQRADEALSTLQAPPRPWTREKFEQAVLHASNNGMGTPDECRQVLLAALAQKGITVEGLA